MNWLSHLQVFAFEIGSKLHYCKISVSSLLKRSFFFVSLIRLIKKIYLNMETNCFKTLMKHCLVCFTTEQGWVITCVKRVQFSFKYPIYFMEMFISQVEPQNPVFDILGYIKCQGSPWYCNRRQFGIESVGHNK